MRLPIPFGRKGLIAAAAIAAGVVFWRVRSQRQEALDREWEEEVHGAIKEGAAAGRAATAGGDSVPGPGA